MQRQVRGQASPKTLLVHDAVRQKCSQALREVEANRAEGQGGKVQAPEIPHESPPVRNRLVKNPACPGSENERLLQPLFAQSPSPPRWADRSQLDADGNPSLPGATVEPVNDIIPYDDDIGKWGRGSLVGAQVRSTSELRRVASHESLVAQAQIRSASEGAKQQRPTPIQRRLFAGLSNKPFLSKPPPSFPPPDGEATMEHTLDVTSISCASSIITTATSVVPVAEPVLHEKRLLQCHEADQAATGPASLMKSLATPSRARNTPPASLSLEAPIDRSEDKEPFGILHKRILEKFEPQSPQAASAIDRLKELEAMLKQEDRSGSAHPELVWQP